MAALNTLNTLNTLNRADLTTIITDIISAAATMPGVTAAATAGSLESGLSATVRLGAVETIEFTRSKSLGITLYKGQKSGSVSITDLSADAIDSALQAASRIADYTEADPYNGLADKDRLAKNIPDLKLEQLAAVTPEQAIEYAMQCEAAALGYDKQITNSDGANFSTHQQFYVYANSDNFIGAYPTTRYAAYCTVIGQDASGMQRDYDYTIARDINDLTAVAQVGIKAAEKTIARLGGRKIKTCKAPVLFIPKVATSFWGCLVGAISGGSLYRKSSFLLDSLNTKIFPDHVYIKELPHMIKGIGSAPFDSEGVATYDKDIIKAGVLSTYLLSSYSARRLGMQTTGNAGGAHNLNITAGPHDFEKLVKEMATGLIVTELLGSGTNLVTGDYSHGAAGFWVENGAIQYPVEEITIAGNLRDMFANIVTIGNDIDRRSNFMTGSVLLESMTIAGS